MAETVRIEIPIEVTDNTDPELSNITDSLEDVEQAARRAQNSVDRAGRTVTQFDRSANRTQRSLSSWMKQKYQVLLEAKDKISPILDKLKTGLRTVGGKTWNVTMKAVDLATAPIRGVLNLLKNPVFQVGAVLGVSISLKDTVDTYADFEATMSRVQALSNANASQMEQLTAKAKEMGAQTKFSGTESAEAFTYMAQAGWQVQDMVDGIGGIMSLAAADGLDLATTTDIVSNALTAFGMKAKDTAEFADVLAVASSATNTNVSDLGEAFKYIAPVAGAMGYSIQDASIALGLIETGAYGNIDYSITFTIYKELKIYTTSELKIAAFVKKTVPRPTPAPQSSRTHTVKSGDTLWGIASKYYGSGTSWQKIYSANSSTIEATAKRYVIPWLKSRIEQDKMAAIEKMVTQAVLYAQQVLTSKSGAEKKAIVTDLLKEMLTAKNISITDEQLNILIEAAVKQMKMEENAGIVIEAVDEQTTKTE